jgi:hypothetical protein
LFAAIKLRILSFTIGAVSAVSAEFCLFTTVSLILLRLKQTLFFSCSTLFSCSVFLLSFFFRIYRIDYFILSTFIRLLTILSSMFLMDELNSSTFSSKTQYASLWVFLSFRS